MIIIQEIYSQELWSFIHHGVVTCLVCQKLCTGLFTCPYGAKTIALPACHALGCPVCQAAKVTCTAGAQWEKIVIFIFSKQILIKSFIDGTADCFDNRRGTDEFFLLLIS